MPRNKRSRFPATAYMHRAEWMVEEFAEWNQTYLALARQAQTEWLELQLTRRAVLADDMRHTAEHLVRELWRLVQTPIAPPAAARDCRREDRGSEIVPGSATEDVSLSDSAASGCSNEPGSQPRPHPQRSSGGTTLPPTKRQSPSRL